MRLIIRYLSPFLRSRRRFSFLLVLCLLLCATGLLLFIESRPQSNDFQIIVKENDTDSLLKESKPAVVTSKKESWPIDAQGRSLKKKFLVLDQTSMADPQAGEGEQMRCESSNTTFTWTRQQSRIEEVDFVLSHDAPGGEGFPFNQIHLNQDQQQYTMAFIMESEVHSSTGDSWAKYHFKMTYNLDDSYPEPATYFDVNKHIIDLLKPPTVIFEDKEKHADVVWIISNCNAHNAREGFVQRLMAEMKVDSYGSCLSNRQGYGARMTDNVDAYVKYKFVLAIENSNCVDYVTEKLVKAVESGSIPIVAGRDGRPDYRRYMPDHSYINIYDYPSIKALADDLKRIANNKTLYESYLWYKKHGKSMKQLIYLDLEGKLKHFAEVIHSNATMLTDGIAAKEKSENKICKLIRFIRQTPWQEIARYNRTGRAGPSVACLPSRGIISYFDSKSNSVNQTVKS